MAKEKMICPFSGRLCRDCALYRGRHYFLCYKPQYRGSLKKFKKVPKKKTMIEPKVLDKELFYSDTFKDIKPSDPFSEELPDYDK